MALVTVLLVLFLVLGILLGPLAMAVLSASLSEERGLRVARKSIALGLKSIWRPAITFNASDELTLKRRSYDEKHDTECISFGGLTSSVKRYLHDPQDRLHSFYGTPFGFVDELFGVVVDPRDVDVGRSIRKAQANSQYEHRVERGGHLHEAVKAVFERPRGNVGVRLPDVSTLVGGSFDSQVVDRIRDYYQTSQAPRSQTSALRQLLVPIGAFIVVVMMGLFAAGQGGGGGGSAPSGDNSTISIGAMLLLASASRIDIDWEEVNWQNVGVGLGIVVLIGVVGGGLLLAFPAVVSVMGIPLPLGLWAVIMLGVGMVIPAFIASFFGRSLGPVGMALGKLYLTIGLLGFDRPVINYSNGEYDVVEYDRAQWPIEPKWYRFAMTRIGVSFANQEENWPDGTTISRGKVTGMAESGDKHGAPTGHVATDHIAVDDIKGFVPEDPAEDATFVRTDRTTGWLFEAGQDRRLMTAALQSAKQDFGGGQKPVGDKWILGATLVAMAMGAVFDWVVFF